MQQLLNTLYVTVPDAYLRLDGDTLHVLVEHEKKLQVPLHHLGAIVCFGDVMITPSLIGRCAADGRSVVYLDRNGRFRARVEGPVSGNILLRQAQFKKEAEAGFALDVARACVAGKLQNSRQLLMRAARDAKSEEDSAALRHATKLMARQIERLPQALNLDEIRGLEGDGARVYFGVLSNVIRQDKRDTFAMNGRSRRPPLDRINALLSFLYSMLMNDCRSALEGVGLDPQLGFLHAVRPGRAALALDLMEEFRSAIADRLALTLINREQINGDDFDERVGGATYLNDAGRKKVITAYQARKQEEISHPLLETQIAIGLLPHIQARLLARTLRGDMDGYLPFVSRG